MLAALSLHLIVASLCSSIDPAAGMEDSELPNIGGEASLALDNPGPKLAEFANRPTGKLHLGNFVVIKK